MYTVLHFKTDLFEVHHLCIKAAQGLDQVGGPAHVEDRCGTALLPFTDAVIEAQQVGKAFWVLEC